MERTRGSRIGQWPSAAGNCIRPIAPWLLIGCSALGSAGDLFASEPAARKGIGSWFRLSRVDMSRSPSQPEAQQRPSLKSSAQGDAASNPRATTAISTPAAQTAVVSEPQAEAALIQPVTAQDAVAEIVPAQNVVVPPEPIAAPPTAEDARAAADEQGLTLEMLTALADSHHPRLTAAYQRIQSAQGRAHQAGLYPNPIASISSPQIDGKESQYNGFVSQEFVTAGKLKLDVAAIQREVSQAQCSWQQERIDILTSIRQQFYVTLTAQQRVRVLESLVKIASHSRDVSQKLLAAGEGTRGDTLLFDIEVERAEVALQNASTNFEVGRRQLAILAAVPDMQIDALMGDLEAQLPEYDLQELRFSIAMANPQANIARLEIDRNAYRLQRATVQPVPNIDVMGGYQRQVGIPSENQGLFQVSMSVPLWNKNQGNIFAAQSELAGARADLQRVELDLGNQAANSLATYRTAHQLTLRYEEQILPRARQTLSITQQLYEQGQIDFLRLLQTQKTLLEAELARLDAQEQRWVAAAAIARLLMQESFP